MDRVRRLAALEEQYNEIMDEAEDIAKDMIGGDLSKWTPSELTELLKVLPRGVCAFERSEVRTYLNMTQH